MHPDQVVSSGLYSYEPYGSVKVTVRSRSRNISGRWNYGRLEVSVPPGLPYSELTRALDKWKTRFREKRQSEDGEAPFYSIGQRIDFVDFSVTIAHSPTLTRGGVSVCRGKDSFVVGVDRDLDLANIQVARMITSMIERIADFVAQSVLINRAREEAERVGVSPTGWLIGRGHRVLGTCNAVGVIKLSHCLLMMPLELQRFVICHELSHLSELNHNETFHMICDAYLGGREKELNDKLKIFRWPVFY